jgi:GNAT superfamily N-acetyltransferase
LFHQLGYDLPANAIAPLLADPPEGNVFYVAVVAEAVVGIIAIARSFYIATLDHLLRVTAFCVDHACRRQGIGAALLRAAEQQAPKDLGTAARQLEVTCALHRLEAHCFYEKQGFERQGWRWIKSLLPSPQDDGL